MSTPRLRRIRLRLFARDPSCWWCARTVIELGRSLAIGEPAPSRMATLDHLHTRGDPLRLAHGGCECQRWVLACHKCNTTCLKHWRMVPKALQQRVWATYRHGQEIDKNPSDAYLVAQGEAVDAVADREHKTRRLKP